MLPKQYIPLKGTIYRNTQPLVHIFAVKLAFTIGIETLVLLHALPFVQWQPLILRRRITYYFSFEDFSLNRFIVISHINSY